MHDDLKIDKELMNYLPRHTPEERERLRQLLIAEGCLDPVRIWAGKNIVVDGMERVSICREEQIKFKTTELEFKNKEAVKDWMSENQVGRRNLEGQQWQYHIGRAYNAAKSTHGGDRKSDEAEPAKDAAANLADKENVSPSTIKRAGKFAELVDEAGEKAPEIKDAILGDGKSIPPKKLKEIAGMTPAKARKAAAAAIEGNGDGKEPEPAEVELAKIVTDGDGKRVTDPRFVDAFADREEFASLIRTAKSLQSDMKRLAGSAGGAHMHIEALVSHQRFVIDELKSRTPAIRCKACKGEKVVEKEGKRKECEACSGVGWIDEFRRRRLKK